LVGIDEAVTNATPENSDEAETDGTTGATADEGMKVGT
jgi:hypothetical protein